MKNKENFLSWDKMNEKQMEYYLMDLVDTPTWQAIYRYLMIRSNLVDNTLRTVDPFKEPTTTARAQGIRNGLWDLWEYVEKLVEKKKEAEKEKEEGHKKNE